MRFFKIRKRRRKILTLHIFTFLVFTCATGTIITATFCRMKTRSNNKRNNKMKKKIRCIRITVLIYLWYVFCHWIKFFRYLELRFALRMCMCTHILHFNLRNMFYGIYLCFVDKISCLLNSNLHDTLQFQLCCFCMHAQRSKTFPFLRSLCFILY